MARFRTQQVYEGRRCGSAAVAVLREGPEGRSEWCVFVSPDAQFKAEQTAVALNLLETVNSTRVGIPIEDLQHQVRREGVEL